MFLRFLLVVMFSVLPLNSVNAQQFPYQRDDDNAKGVCTINGKVFYGIDCYCYSSEIGSLFVTITLVTLFIFFFISGCIWACIFSCCKCVMGDRKEDMEFGVGSLRSSMRSMRTGRMRDDTPI